MTLFRAGSRLPPRLEYSRTSIVPTLAVCLSVLLLADFSSPLLLTSSPPLLFFSPLSHIDLVSAIITTFLGHLLSRTRFQAIVSSAHFST